MKPLLEAERAVAGMLLLKPQAWDDIAEIVTAADFTEPRYRYVVECMAEHAGRVSCEAAKDWLRTRRPMDDWSETLLSLWETSTSTQRIAFEAKRLAARSRSMTAAHEMRLAANECEQVDSANADDAAVHQDSIEHALYLKLEQRHEGATAELAETVRRDREARLTDGVVAGIDTGIGDLDRILRGRRPAALRPGWFVIGGARPSIGKSAFGLQVATNVARAKIPALFFSVEMAQDEIDERLALSGVDVRGLPLYLCEPRAPTVSALRSVVRRLKKKGLELVVVDYIQFMHEAGHESRLQELASISRGLKQLAKDYQVTVLALAQLHRDADKEQPRLYHLRECGSLEQDADVAILLSRGEQVGHLHCDVAKHRHGRTDECELAFDKERQLIGDLAPFRSASLLASNGNGVYHDRTGDEFH